MCTLNSIPSYEIEGDANIVGRDNIIALVKAEDHSTIQDVVIQIFGGSYERLRDAYIHPWPVFERVNLARFSGREWLLDKIDDFLHEKDRGYLVLEANAGLGKTTFLAWLVRERGYIHHFSELARGIDRIPDAQRNLAAQIVRACELGGHEDLDVLPGGAARPDFLHNLLKQASDNLRDGKKIILVVDGLDEAGALPNQNALGLPPILPRGVYIIASQRPIQVPLSVDVATTPRRLISLLAHSPHNLADMRKYLKRAATWTGVAQALQRGGYSQLEFVDTLMAKCRGVWVYLHYVVHEIERGERSPLDLDMLPEGITQYYARNWAMPRAQDEHAWYSIYLPVLSTLAALGDSVTSARLCTLAGIEDEQTLEYLLMEKWVPFLTSDRSDTGFTYRLYHTSLREFFEGQIDPDQQLTSAEWRLVEELKEATRRAHSRIADQILTELKSYDSLQKTTQSYTGQDVYKQYGLRYLITHLGKAGRIRDIQDLLASETETGSNSWYDMHFRMRNLTGYMVDLEQSRQLMAQHDLSEAEADRLCPYIGHEILLSLCQASLNTLANNIPSDLLRAMAMHRVWPTNELLVYARQVPETKRRVQTLNAITPYMPSEHLSSVVMMARSIRNETLRTSVLTSVARQMQPSLFQELLDAVKEMRDLYCKTSLLAEVVPFVGPEIKSEVISEALTYADTLYGYNTWAEAVTALLPHLPSDQRNAMVRHLREEISHIAVPIVQAQVLLGIYEFSPEQTEELLVNKIIRTIGELSLADLAKTIPTFEKLPFGRRTKLLLNPSETLTWAQKYLLVQLVRRNSSEYVSRAVLDHVFPGGSTLSGQTMRWLMPRLPFGVMIRITQALLPASTDFINELIASSILLARQGQSREGLILAMSPPPHLRVEALHELIPLLGEPLREVAIKEALVSAETLPTSSEKAAMLGKLADHFSPEARMPMLEAALEKTQIIEDPIDQLETQLKLAPYLPGAFVNELTKRLLNHPLEQLKADGLVQLAPYLSEAMLQLALESAVKFNDLELRIRALAAISRHLPDAKRQRGWKKTLKTIEALRFEPERSTWLVASIPQLDKEPLLLKASELVFGMINYNRTNATGRLARFLMPSQTGYRSRRLRKAFELVETVIGVEFPKERFALVKQFIHMGQYRRAFAVLLSTATVDWPAKFLEVVDQIPPIELLEALDAIRELYLIEFKAMALATLATRLPAAQQLDIWNETLRLAQLARERWPYNRYVPSMLHLLPSLATAGYPDEALEVARQLANTPDEAIRTAIELAPYLSNSSMERVFDLILDSQISSEVSDLLASMAPYIPESRQEAAVHLAESIQDEAVRVRTIERLVPFLAEPLILQTLAIFEKVGQEHLRAQAIASTASSFPTSLCLKAWDLAQTMSDPSNCFVTRVELVSRLPESFLEAVLQQAMSLNDDAGDLLMVALARARPPEIVSQDAVEYARQKWPAAGALVYGYVTKAQKSLVRTLVQKGSIDKALDIAHTLPAAQLKSFGEAYEWTSPRGEILVELLPTLETARRSQLAEDIVHFTKPLNAASRCVVLMNLASRLSPDVQPVVMKAAKNAVEEVPNEDRQLELLSCLAKKSAQLGYVNEAMDIATEIDDTPMRQAALTELTTFLVNLPRNRLYWIWKSALPSLSARRREDFLSDIAALGPVINLLGGEEAVAKTYRAIEDVSRWWP